MHQSSLPANGNVIEDSARPAGDASAKGPAKSEQADDRVFKLSTRTNSLLGVQIVATGSFVPDNIVTNEFLENSYGFEPGWIEQRTGIRSRRHAPPEMATSDMCVEAAKRAMQNGHVTADEIDLVIIATFTPDYSCPSAACLVQHRLGIEAPAFDLSAACSGFMFALVTASQYVATGNAKMALVIGCDLNSRMLNPKDQRTYPLFGDGAGAVLVARGELQQGLLCYQTGSDGSGGPSLVLPCSGTRMPATVELLEQGKQYLHMDGRAVFKWAIRALTDTVDLVLHKTGMTVHDVDLFLMHQANIRIINYAAEQLKIPQEKIFNNLQEYGNTSAGSIPLILDEAYNAGRIQRGDTILMSGFGAGLTWGTSLFRW